MQRKDRRDHRSLWRVVPWLLVSAMTGDGGGKAAWGAEGREMVGCAWRVNLMGSKRNVALEVGAVFGFPEAG